MFASRRIILSLASATLALSLSNATVGQPLLVGPALQGNPVEAPITPATPPPAADKRTQNTEQLRLAQRKLDTNGATDKAAAHDVAFYQTRDAVLGQQDAVEQRIKEMEARKTDLEKQVKSPPAIDRTYTFAELDQLKDDLAASQAREALLADKLASAKMNVGSAQTALDESQVKRRQAQRALDNNKDASKANELSTALKRAQQEFELATETLALRKREVDRAQLAQETLHISVQIQKNQVAQIAPNVALTESDYQDQIDEIKRKEEAATSALAAAQAALEEIEPQRAEAKKQLEAATDANRALLTEKYQAVRRTRLRFSEEIDSQTQRLQHLAELRRAWDQRYRIASLNGTADSELYAQLKAQQKDAKNVLNELASSLRTQIGSIGEVRDTLSRVNKKADAAAKGPAEVLPWIQEQQRQLEGMQRIYERNLVTIEDSRRVHEKLVEELSASVKANTPTSLAMDVLFQVESVWNYTFMHINNEPITLGMAIQGLTTLAVGWILSRFVSAMVAYRILKRFRLSKDATSAIRSLVFYSMLFGVVAESLHMVNVDLTAFTILGGALAIGVGFGSQALINNFIGGLIMLAERPVRLGERITFGNLDGVVEDVGFRCTKLRTNTDHLVTIPNSTLVNESIENIDRRRTIRRNMTLAVTYNITREQLAKAVQAIRDILEERDIRERIHPIVGFEEFLPRVFFSEFAAESLTIQVVYWYAPVDWWAYMEHAERVNFRVMEEFERMGIDFAFPSKTSFVKNAKKPPGREPGSYAA